MNFANIAMNISSKLELSASLVNKSFWEVLWQILKENIFTAVVRAYEVVVMIIHTVCTWVLSVIDFLFVVVRQLCGINTDFSSLENVEKNDIVLQFITSKGIATIMRNIVAIAVVLILLFGIIAIIKSEYSAVQDLKSTGEIKNDKSGIIKSILQSFALIILVPIVLIGSIILSNGIIQTLYRATTGGADISIGTQIYLMSTYDANKYRIYAKNNKKIPITYSFNQMNQDALNAVMDYDTDVKTSDLAENVKELKQASEFTQGLATFSMFYFDEFFDMDEIDTLQRFYGADDYEEGSTQTLTYYNLLYDAGIRTYKYEYYVNADLVDYQLKTRTKIYLKTAEEAYESCLAANYETGITLDNDKNAYVFEVNYNDGKNALRYESKKGAYDESKGAVFIACVQDYYTDANGNSQLFYRPIHQNAHGFTSDYLGGENNIVVMKGVFDTDYPTAIRKENGAIVYYRDKVNVPTFSNLFPRISYEMPEGATEHPTTAIITGAIKFVTGIDVHDFLPYIYFDIDFMHLFLKSESKITIGGDNNSVDVGYSIDYLFSDKDVKVDQFYKTTRINIVILVFAIVLVGRKVLAAVFGALKRFVDIMFLYILYPAAVATIPLKGTSSFGKWVKQMIGKVVSMYGLVVGINLGLLLIPLSQNINLFKPSDFGDLPFVWMRDLSSGTINFLVQMLFVLVGMYFIFEIPKIVQPFVTGNGKEENEVIAQGEKVIKETSEIYKKAADVVSGRALKDKIKEAADWVPGSAIYKDHVQNIKRKVAAENNQAAEDKAKQDFANAMSGGDKSGDEAPKDDTPTTPTDGGNGGGEGGSGALGAEGAGDNSANESQEAQKENNAAAPENAEGEAPAEEGGEAKEGEESSEEKSNDATGEGEAPKNTEEESHEEEEEKGPKENTADDKQGDNEKSHDADDTQETDNGTAVEDQTVEDSDEEIEESSNDADEGSEVVEGQSTEEQTAEETEEVSEKVGSSLKDLLTRQQAKPVKQEWSGDEVQSRLMKERYIGDIKSNAKGNQGDVIKEYIGVSGNEYQDYLKKNNIKDSIESQVNFYVDQMMDRGEGKHDQFTKKYNFAKSYANLKNGHNDNIRAFADVESDSYNTWLNGKEDNDRNRAMYYAERKTNAESGKHDETEFKHNREISQYAVDENAQEYSAVDKSGYNNYLQQTNSEDGAVSKAKYFYQEKQASKNSDENRDKFNNTYNIASKQVEFRNKHGIK